MKKEKPKHHHEKKKHGHHHHHHGGYVPILPKPPGPDFERDTLRLEGVTVSVGFDDLLDITLGLNHPHFDTMIVVTDHADRKTQACARKHGATCVQTDLFQKNGRGFNKGAAINSGFDYFQFRGWRCHIDSDILLPDNFRRILFNHSHLERHCLYGVDRFNVVGADKIKKLKSGRANQHNSGLLLGETEDDGKLGHRLVCNLRGYLPLGFFQMWHASTQKPYPYSLGTAAHDDMMFSALWPTACRRHLPGVICFHLLPTAPKVGENWDGKRKQPRLE
jgi:hypothetical protein